MPLNLKANYYGFTKRFGGLAVIYPALPTCPVAYIQKSDFHLINVFCVVIVVKKCKEWWGT